MTVVSMEELAYFPINQLLKYVQYRIAVNRHSKDYLAGTLRLEEKHEVEMDYEYLVIELHHIEEIIQRFPEHSEKGIPVKAIEDYVDTLQNIINTTTETVRELPRSEDESIQQYGKRSYWGVRVELFIEVHRIIHLHDKTGAGCFICRNSARNYSKKPG